VAPPQPITAGKGSTRDVRKINPGRAAAAATAAGVAAAELVRLKAVPNKTKADAAAVKAAERALKRALDRLRKSETNARKGRGDRR